MGSLQQQFSEIFDAGLALECSIDFRKRQIRTMLIFNDVITHTLMLAFTQFEGRALNISSD